MKTPTIRDGWISMPEDEFETLLAQAAERGARAALATVGLENGHAARDVRELRDLLDAYRAARRTVWHTVLKMVTTGLVAALITGAAIKFKVFGAGQ